MSSVAMVIVLLHFLHGRSLMLAACTFTNSYYTNMTSTFHTHTHTHTVCTCVYKYVYACMQCEYVLLRAYRCLYKSK